jgi:hypothetical protein
MSHRRYLCSELVTLLYEDHFHCVRQTSANLEEISATHATLLVDEALEPGSPVSFYAKSQVLHGIVESGEFDQILGWFVKIELNSASRWDVRMFIPEHFLALSDPIFSLDTKAVAMCAS